MKILSIEFEKHPILGNLKLDFTDKNGNPVDTVLLAGENGCGKTTILEELQNLWDTGKNNSNYKGRYITTKIYLNKEEINQIIQKISETNRNNIMPQNPTGVFVVKNDLSTGVWRCFDIKYQQIETKSFVPINCDFMVYLRPFAQSIFSPVDINYHSQNITSIQATSLDSDSSGRKKSNENLATEINQLLVDAEASDASEVLAWVRAHPTQIMPQHLVSPRIKRFSNAFSKMFDDIEFSRVDNVQSIKTIFFKRKNTEIPISRLSSGEKQIVYRGAYLLKDIQLDLGKAVLIDEPEISLHPEWQKKILGYYQSLFSDETGKQLSQMFVATHSPFIIHNQNRHNDKVVVLKKDDNGNIFQSDKPEYYACNSCKAIKDSFSVYDFNDINEKIIFVEDDSHKVVLEELLKDKDFKIVPIGTHDKVLACSEALNDKDNFFFLVDGDRKEGLDASKKYAKHTHRLNKYCIENYLFDREVFANVISFLGRSISPEDLIQNVINRYNPCDTKFDIIKTLFNCNQFSFDKLDNTDCSELIKQLGKNDFLAQKQYDLIRIFVQEAKKLGKFEKMFSEVLAFLEVA